MFFYIVCQAPIKSFTASVRSCVCHIKVMHIETSFYHVFLLCVSSPYQIIYSECAFKCVCHIKVIYIKTSLSSHPTLCVKSKDLMFFHFVCQVPIKSSTASVCLCGCHIKVTHIEKSPIKVIDIETTFHK